MTLGGKALGKGNESRFIRDGKQGSLKSGVAADFRR